MITASITTRLIEIAKRKFPDRKILPCGDCRTLEQCISFWNDEYVFWFNLEDDHSTRVVTLPV